MALKDRPEGFLLVELLVIMAVSILLFGVAAHQHGLIIQTRQLALNRLTLAAQIRNAVERIQSEQLTRQGNWQEDQTTIKWHTAPFACDHVSLPSNLKPPKNFKPMTVEASMAGSYARPLSIQLVTGVFDAES